MIKHEKNSDKINFDDLVERVKKMPFNDGQVLLWGETFKLDRWHFITKPVIDINNVQPFIGEVDGKGWIFAFTDDKHIVSFGESQDLANNEEELNTIALEPKKAVEWLIKLSEHDIYGIRFNEGNNGWFAPIANLRPMMEYLNN